MTESDIQNLRTLLSSEQISDVNQGTLLLESWMDDERAFIAKIHQITGPVLNLDAEPINIPTLVENAHQVDQVHIFPFYELFKDSPHAGYLAAWTIGHLASLNERFRSHTDICFENCRLTTLPSNIVNFENIQSLDLWENHFTEIPEVVFSLSTLTKLDILDNHLQYIPHKIAELSNLEELIPREKALRTLPQTIGLLTNLKRLELTSNRITQLPKGIGHCETLEEIDITQNPFHADAAKIVESWLPNCEIHFSEPLTDADFM